MIPVKYIDPEDLPLYAMKLLPPEIMEELTLDLQHSAEGRRQLAEIYGDLGLLAHSGEMVELPATAKQRFLKNVAREKKALPISLVDQPAPAPPAEVTSIDEAPRRSAGRVLPWAGWLIAAGVSAVAVLQHQQNDRLQHTVALVRLQDAQTRTSSEAANQLLDTLKDPNAVHATLTSAETKPAPSGRVVYVPNKGSLVFIASNLDPLQPAKTYELWVIPSDGRPAMPAGTFKPDQHGNASVMMPELTAGIEAKAFGVTIEDAAGSLVPTAPIILKGSPS